MTKYIILVVILVIVGYGLIKAWPLIEGPSLSINTPQNNATFDGGIVAIKGNAARASQVTLDGAPMLHQENGDFSVTLAFPSGVSELTFVATDFFGRKVTAERTIFVP
jgi:Glucodextranase, domain B